MLSPSQPNADPPPHRARVSLLAFALLLAVGCSGPGGPTGAADAGSAPPLGLEATLQQETATDHAAADDRVEVELTVDENGWQYSETAKTSAMTYNGTIPGPMIRAELGETLQIRVTNRLDEVTSIHFHGVDLPATEDGSNFSQPGIPPGESWTYEFEVRQAALTWFHPHFNTDVQIEKGLYGLLLFESPQQKEALAELGLTEARTSYLAIGQVLLNAKGEHKPFFDESPEKLTPMERVEQVVNGRSRVPSEEQRAEFVVNGRLATGLHGRPGTLHVEAGKPHRLRILNAGNGAMLRLAIHSSLRTAEGKNVRVKVPFHRIGGEQGLLSKPRKIESVSMVESHEHDRPSSGHDHTGSCEKERVPSLKRSQGVFLQSGERTDLVFVPPKDLPEGTQLSLWTHDWPNGEHRALPKKNGDGEVQKNADGEPLVASKFGHIASDGCRRPRKLLRLKVHAGASDGGAWTPPASLPRQWPIEKLKANSAEGDPLLMAFGHAPPKPDGSLTTFVNVRKRDALRQKIERSIRAIEDGDEATSPPEMIMPEKYEPIPFDKAKASSGFNVRYGQTRVWWIVNFTGAVHPQHMHGVPGQLLEIVRVDLKNETVERSRRDFSVRRDAPEYEDVWKLPGRPGKMMKSFTVTKILMEFDDSKRPEKLRRTQKQMTAWGFRHRELQKKKRSDGSFESLRSGGWATHCHIESHIASGMMAWYNLLPRDDEMPSYLVP